MIPGNKYALNSWEQKLVGKLDPEPLLQPKLEWDVLSVELVSGHILYFSSLLQQVTLLNSLLQEMTLPIASFRRTAITGLFLLIAL